MRKVNTIGITQANKVMLMSATAYNLKKYLKFIKKEVQTAVKAGEHTLTKILELISGKKKLYQPQTI